MMKIETTKETDEQLVEIQDISPNQAELLVEKFTELGAHASVDDLETHTTDILDGDAEKASILVNLALDLARVRNGLGEYENRNLLLASTHQKSGDLECVLRLLKDLTDTRVFAIAAKAQELSNDVDNIVSDVRILSDLRPIFSRDASTIHGSVIVNTLRIDFHGSKSEDEQTISLNIQPKHLQLLMGVVMRAMRKNKLLGKTVHEGFVAAGVEKGEMK